MLAVSTVLALLLSPGQFESSVVLNYAYSKFSAQSNSEEKPNKELRINIQASAGCGLLLKNKKEPGTEWRPDEWYATVEKAEKAYKRPEWQFSLENHPELLPEIECKI